MQNKKAQIQPSIKATPKKSKLWLWLIIIIILIIAGIGIYFLLSNGGDGTGLIGGNKIPTPPPLPE